MRLHRIALPFAAIIAVVTLAQAAHANVMIIIDKSAQKMTVTVNGEDRYTWPVSTGRDGYDTPSGDFQPFRMEKDHFSREWDDAPMPHSIFFTRQGHAIHAHCRLPARRQPQSKQRFDDQAVQPARRPGVPRPTAAASVRRNSVHIRRNDVRFDLVTSHFLR